EQELYLALFHGIRRVAIDCDGEGPARQSSALASRPSSAALKRWLRRWAAVRHREAAERTALTAISMGARPAALADLLRPRPIGSLPIAATPPTSSTKHSRAFAPNRRYRSPL